MVREAAFFFNGLRRTHVTYCGVAINAVAAESRFPLEVALDQARAAVAA
jgi:hypothetical protein